MSAEATIGAKVLREAARDLRENAAWAWGGPATWITTGEHVANLAADWLDETATDLDATQSATCTTPLTCENDVVERGLYDTAHGEPRCPHVAASKWGPVRCVLSEGHTGRHAYGATEGEGEG